MAQTFKIPMSRFVLTIFLITVAAVSATVVWCFNSGFMWSALCLIAVAGPLSALYWYMLYINPKRASITVADEGVLLAAPPFASAVIPWASVTRTFTADLSDPSLKVAKTKKFMQFAGYRSGLVQLESGKEAVIVTNQKNIQAIETEERYYLLGPSDFEEFSQAIDTIMQQK